MADQNSSSPHPCDAPDIGPIEFLQVVMHDDLFSISIRMKAAKHLALIEAKPLNPPPLSTSKIPGVSNISSDSHS
jgi:hypothetical protein